MNTGTPGHILVIKLGALGDFIQALGPMAAIRTHHPHDRITLLTTAPFESIAKASGYIDDILIDSRPRWFELKAWLALRATLNNGGYMRVYDLQNNDRTAFYLNLFKRKPEWVGAAPGASHRNASPERTAGKAFDGHVQTLALASIKNIRPDRLEWMNGRGDYPGLKSPYALIVPGSAANHPEKRWPHSHYAALCKKLIGAGFHPVLLGGEAESDILSEIENAAPGVLNLCGQTNLFDIAALARSAYGAIGNDTGPMHVIAPTGCPTIVLFSKNSQPHRHAPKGHDVATLQKDDLNNLDVKDVWQIFRRQHSLP